MSFNVQEVFSSLESFLSSGYVLLGVIVVLGIGALKKIGSLLIIGAIIFAIWFFYQDAVTEAFWNVIDWVKTVTA